MFSITYPAQNCYVLLNGINEQGNGEPGQALLPARVDHPGRAPPALARSCYTRFTWPGSPSSLAAPQRFTWPGAWPLSPSARVHVSTLSIPHSCVFYRPGALLSCYGLDHFVDRTYQYFVSHRRYCPQEIATMYALTWLLINLHRLY